MAVPDDMSLRNFYGSFIMNKQLSDPTDQVLQLQGVNWIIRQAVKHSTVYLTIKQYTDEENKVHIDIDQLTTPGNFTNMEPRTVDGEWRDKEDKIFGKVKGYTKFMNVKDIQEDYLREGWDPKFLEQSGGEVIDAYVTSVGFKGGEEWEADQIWGFAIVEGVRRFIRHIIVKKGKTVYKVKTIYDYQKPK